MALKQTIKKLFSALFVVLPMFATAQTTEGTDFWVTFLQADQGGEDFSLNLAISSRYDCNVTISNPFTNYSEQVSIQKNTTKDILLDSSSSGADVSAARNRQRGTGKICYAFNSEKSDSCAIHVVADQPISLFASNYQYASFDATNILPTSSLQNDYIIQTYSPSDNDGDQASQGSHFAIVATEDNTVVDYYPTARTKRFTDVQTKKDNYFILTAEDSLYLNFQPGSQFTTPVLNKGEVFYVWTGKGVVKDAGDLSGTRVTARDGKKIAVFQGCPHTNIPYKVKLRDHIYSQAMPVKTWGNTFVLTASTNRKRDIYRVLALYDETEVYINGQMVHKFDFSTETKHFWEFEIGGSYGSLAAPQVSGTSCYVTTSCPCAMHQFMVSQQYDGDSKNNGDPAMLWINPIEQQIDQITFTTYDSKKGTTAHNVNIVTANPAGITLDGNDISSEFQQVDGSSTYWFARHSLGSATQSHTIKASSGGFIAHVYGFTKNESYAYSAGGYVKSLEQAIIINGEVFTPETKNTLCGKDTIHFVCDLNYDVTSITWDFGDGTLKGSGASVDHYYAKTGTYNALCVIQRESSNVCQGQLAIDSIPIEVTIGRLEFEVTDTIDDICASRQLRLYYQNTGTRLTTQNCTFSFNQKAQDAGINSLQMSSDEKGSLFLLTIPQGAEQGDGYAFQVEINTGCGDAIVNVGFTIPFDPTKLVKQLWDNILVVFDTIETADKQIIFTEYQWYKNGEIMDGEDGQMLNLYNVIDTVSEYTARLTTADGEVIWTCPYFFSHQENNNEGKDLDEFEFAPLGEMGNEIHAIIIDAGGTIFITTTAEGVAELFDITGNKIGDTIKFSDKGGFVKLPKERGIYILRVETPNEKRNMKIYVV